MFNCGPLEHYSSLRCVFPSFSYSTILTGRPICLHKVYADEPSGYPSIQPPTSPTHCTYPPPPHTYSARLDMTTSVVMQPLCLTYVYHDACVLSRRARHCVQVGHFFFVSHIHPYFHDYWEGAHKWGTTSVNALMFQISNTEWVIYR